MSLRKIATQNVATITADATVLDAAKGAIKKIYYDPLAHDKNAESKSAESILRWASFAISVLLFGYTVVTYMLRDSQAMCAITTLGNILD